MKPLQIVALVIAGALGGALVMKTMKKEPEVAQAPAPARPSETATAPAPIRISPPSAPAPAPVTVPEPEAKPSPVVERPKAVRQTAPQHVVPHYTAPPPVIVHRPVIARAQTPPQSSIPVPRPEPAPTRPEPLSEPIRQSAPPLTAPPTGASPTDAPPTAAPPARAETENVTPPQPPAPRKVTLNAGTLIPVRLVDGLSSERNMPGDTFIGTLNKELVVDGLVIAERGARVEGRVASADRGGKVRGVASLAVEIPRIRTSDGQNVAIATDAFERTAEPTHNQDAAKVGGAAAVGAVIGAIAGGGKGAAIGAGVGGAAGAGDVLLTRGRAATLPSETRISFRLRAPVTLTENGRRD